MTFHNVYEDERRAEAYARLEFPGTYYLAYRDLPAILAEHAGGRKALDFGCGAGRSTRFLKKHGFDATGVDISADMVRKARDFDPSGDYHVIGDGDFSLLAGRSFDLVQSIFTFDNIPTREKKVGIFRGLRSLLKEDGRIVSLVSSPDIYKHEWASFTTKDFSSNKTAKTGDSVWTIMTDVEDRRPVEDVIWYDEDYRDVYREAGLEVVMTYKPLAREDEPFKWVNETQIAPWVIYVLNCMSIIA